MFAVELTFSTDLAFFLRREWRGPGQTVRRTLTEKTAVKDVIEAFGVPHPEVDLIVVAGDGQGRENPRAVDFTWQVQVPVRLQIYGVPAPAEVVPQAPRLQGRSPARFVADGHWLQASRSSGWISVDIWA